MNSLKSTKILVTSLICIITIVLCSCNRTSFDSHNYSTTLELVGYESGNSLAIKYPSGEQAALVPLEMATAGFPGIADTRQDNGDVQFHVFYGYNQKGLHWAVICSGPSLGFMNTNVLLSEDGGKNWSLVSDIHNTPHDVVTGAGFFNESLGFICCRYTNDSGPLIYITKDGGESWNILKVSDTYESMKKIPKSPILTNQSICFPIELRDESENISTVYYSSSNLESWTWS